METLKEKIARAMRADFIGDIVFDEDEIDTMKDECRSFYRAAQSSWSKIYRREDIDELIVLIVNIAKNWHDESEGRFWTKLFGEIFDDGSISPVKFYDEFEYSLKFHNKVLFRSKESKRLFREVFLLHAMAPDTSGESFIWLLWNWFCDPDVINFDYQPGDKIYRQIAAFLENEFGGESDLNEDVSLEGKTYSIKSSFKYLFTQDKDSGIKLLEQIYSAFDEIYFNGKYASTSYFAEFCNTVVNKILSENNVPSHRRKRTATEHIVDDYSKIYSFYEISPDGEVAIIIPEIRAINEPADEYRMEIYNDDVRIYCAEDYIVGTNLKRRIKKIVIPFSSFEQTIREQFNLRIKLFLRREDEDFLLYDSKTSLYREFILFKASRETRQSNCKPGTYYVVHPYGTETSNFTTSSANEINLYTSSVIFAENDSISATKKSIFFNEIPQDSHILIDGKNITGVLFRKDEKEYFVYTKISSMEILLENSEPTANLILTIDNLAPIQLERCSVKTERGLRISFLDLHANANGCHTILISDIVKRKVLHEFNYYISDNVFYKTGKKQFLFDEHTFNVYAQTCNNGENQPLFSNNPSSGIEEISFNYDFGIIVFPLPYIKWRIDENEWHYSSCDKDLWCKDAMLHNNCIIEIDNQSEFNITLFLDDTPIPQSKQGNFLLGDALSEAPYANSHTVNLKIGENCFRLFTIWYQEKLSDLDIDIENRIIDLSRYFIGDKDSEFIVTLKNEEREYCLHTPLTSTFEDTIVDNEYHVQVALVNFYGEAVHLYEDDYILGNPDKFYFNRRKIALQSIRKPTGGKIKFLFYIIELQYLREEAIGAVYSGILLNNKKRQSVEVYKKDERSLKLYYVSGEDLKSIYYDENKKEFTDKDYSGTISCSSFYYDSEEV